MGLIDGPPATGRWRCGNRRRCRLVRKTKARTAGDRGLTKSDVGGQLPRADEESPAWIPEGLHLNGSSTLFRQHARYPSPLSIAHLCTERSYGLPHQPRNSWNAPRSSADMRVNSLCKPKGREERSRASSDASWLVLVMLERGPKYEVDEPDLRAGPAARTLNGTSITTTMRPRIQREPCKAEPTGRTTRTDPEPRCGKLALACGCGVCGRK